MKKGKLDESWCPSRTQNSVSQTNLRLPSWKISQQEEVKKTEKKQTKVDEICSSDRSLWWKREFKSQSHPILTNEICRILPGSFLDFCYLFSN